MTTKDQNKSAGGEANRSSANTSLNKAQSLNQQKAEKYQEGKGNDEQQFGYKKDEKQLVKEEQIDPDCWKEHFIHEVKPNENVFQKIETVLTRNANLPMCGGCIVYINKESVEGLFKKLKNSFLDIDFAKNIQDIAQGLLKIKVKKLKVLIIDIDSISPCLQKYSLPNNVNLVVFGILPKDEATFGGLLRKDEKSDGIYSGATVSFVKEHQPRQKVQRIEDKYSIKLTSNISKQIKDSFKIEAQPKDRPKLSSSQSTHVSNSGQNETENNKNKKQMPNQSEIKDLNWATHIIIQYGNHTNANKIKATILQQLIKSSKACIVKKSSEIGYVEVERKLEQQKQLLGAGTRDQLGKGMQKLKNGQIKVLIVGDQVINQQQNFRLPQHVDLCINWETKESLKLYWQKNSKAGGENCQKGLVITFYQRDTQDQRRQLQTILKQISSQHKIKFIRYSTRRQDVQNVNFLQHFQPLLLQNQANSRKQAQSNQNSKDQSKIKDQKQSQEHLRVYSERNQKTQQFQVIGASDEDENKKKKDKNEQGDRNKLEQTIKELSGTCKEDELKTKINRTESVDRQNHNHDDDQNKPNSLLNENADEIRQIKIDEEHLKELASNNQCPQGQPNLNNLNSQSSSSFCSSSSQSPKIPQTHQLSSNNNTKQNEQGHYQKQAQVQKQKEHVQKQQQQKLVKLSDPVVQVGPKCEQKCEGPKEESIPPVLSQPLETKASPPVIDVKLHQKLESMLYKIERLQSNKQSVEERRAQQERLIVNQVNQGNQKIIGKIQETRVCLGEVGRMSKQAAQKQQQKGLAVHKNYQSIIKETASIKKSINSIVSSVDKISEQLPQGNKVILQKLESLSLQLQNQCRKQEKNQEMISQKMIDIQNDFSCRNEQAREQLTKKAQLNNDQIKKQAQHYEKMYQQLETGLKRQKETHQKQSLNAKLEQIQKQQKQLRKNLGEAKQQILKKDTKLKVNQVEISKLKDQNMKLTIAHTNLIQEKQSHKIGLQQIIKDNKKKEGECLQLEKKLKKSESEKKDLSNICSKQENERKKLEISIQETKRRNEEINGKVLELNRLQEKAKEELSSILNSKYETKKKGYLKKGFEYLWQKNPQQDQNNWKQKIKDMKVHEIINKYIKVDTQRNNKTSKILQDFQEEVPKLFQPFLLSKDRHLFNKINEYISKTDPNNKELTILFEFHKKLIEELIKQNEKKVQFETRICQFRANLKQNWKSNKKVENLKSEYITPSTETEIEKLAIMFQNSANENQRISKDLETKKRQSDHKSDEYQALMKTLEKLKEQHAELNRVKRQKQDTIQTLSEDLRLARQENDRLNKSNTDLQQKQKDLAYQSQQNYKNLEKAHANELRETRDQHQLNLEKLKEELERSSEAKLEKSLFEQKEKLGDEFNQKMDSLNARHSDQVNSILRRSQDLQNKLNQKIKESLKVELNLNSKNYREKLSDLPNIISQIRIMPESIIYNLLDPQYKNFILSSVKDIVPKNITHSRTLFVGYEDSVFNRWLNLIQDNHNILVLIKLTNGHIIGGFSEDPYTKNNKGKGQGFMMSVTNQLVYKVKPQGYGRVLKRDEYFFVFGNDELIIKYKENKPVYSVIFDKTNLFFETKGKNIVDFLGTEKEDGDCERVEFHQLYFK